MANHVARRESVLRSFSASPAVAWAIPSARSGSSQRGAAHFALARQLSVGTPLFSGENYDFRPCFPSETECVRSVSACVQRVRTWMRPARWSGLRSIPTSTAAPPGDRPITSLLVVPRKRQGRPDQAWPGESAFRSFSAGPAITSPVARKREPWHGQSQVCSVGFQATIQPR